MTREEAKANLQALGFEEPTANQITNYLNQFHAGMPKQEPKTEPAQPKTEPKTVDWKETDEYKALQSTPQNWKRKCARLQKTWNSKRHPSSATDFSKLRQSCNSITKLEER